MKALLALLFLLWTVPASAHKPSDSYLSLRVDGTRIEGRWDIALRDLDLARGLDGDGDGRLTWNELRARHGAIEAYALSRLSIAAGGAPCTLAAGSQLVDEHTDGAYTVLPLRGTCAVKPAELTIAYRLFGDVDAQHRGLLRIGDNGDARTAILGGERPVQTVPLAQASAFQQFLAYVRHGAWHIWIGYDHVLFLVSLLLPAVLVRRDGGWQHVPAFRGAATDVLKTVTAFTLAHSLTLAASTLGAIGVARRPVEICIALSIVFLAREIARANDRPSLARRAPGAIAFVFGLLHGLGFAAALAEIGLPRGELPLALLTFNIGVEAGQLVVVAATFALIAGIARLSPAKLAPARHAAAYAIGITAAYWMVERTLAI
jgi:hypothetical protein